MTQRVLLQGTGIGSKGLDSTTMAKRSNGNDFGIFLGNSIRQEAISKEENSKSVEKPSVKTNHDSDKSTGKSNNKRKEMSKDKDFTKAKDSSGLQINDGGAKEKATGLDKLSKEENKPSEDLNTALLGQALAMYDQIFNAIMEELQISSEELTQMMTELGLGLTDLSDPQAIMQLLLKESGATDPTALLLNEDLENTFQSMLRTVNDIQNNLMPDLSHEKIKEIIEQIRTNANEEMIGTDMNGIKDLQTLNELEKDLEETYIQTESGKFHELNDSQEIGEPSHNNITVMDKGNTKDADGFEDGFNESDGFETFLDNLSANFTESNVEFGGETIRVHELREIAQQIVQQVKVMAKPGETTMELQLYPEHLGKVNLTLSSKDGILSAHFIVQNELAKEAVEGQLITLKETLAEQGIRVETIEVTVAGYTFDQGKSQEGNDHSMEREKSTGPKITLEEAMAMSEEPIEDDNTTYTTGDMGYSINYTA